MNSLILFMYIMMIYGLSNMLVHSSGPFKIFEYYRSFMSYMPSNIGEGALCMICTPCQLGILFSLINIFIFPMIDFTPFYSMYGNSLPWYIIIFLDGFITSGSVWLIHTLQEMCERINSDENFIEEEND